MNLTGLNHQNNLRIYTLCLMLSISFFSCKKESPTKSESKPITYLNKALQFDGLDDKIDLFLKPLNEAWTISVWIKGNDTIWNSEEAIISNGWAEIENWESVPLSIRNGYPAVGENLQSNIRLDDQWHHIAVVRNEISYTLFVDGVLQAKGWGVK